MLNADRAPYFHSCPRCGEGGYERLKTHHYCVNCNYSTEAEIAMSSDDDLPIPKWAYDAVIAKPKIKKAKIVSVQNEREGSAA